MYYGLESLLNSKDFGTYELTIGIYNSEGEFNTSLLEFNEKGVSIDGECLTDEDIWNIEIWEEEHMSQYKKVS